MSTQADGIRAYVLKHHVEPWRKSGTRRLAIRAGDVVRGMRLNNATPSVCSALESRMFQQQAGLVLLRREGPRRSTTTTFHYESSDSLHEAAVVPGTEPTVRSRPGDSGPRPVRAQPDHGDTLRTTGLCLVSCVSAKQAVPAPAKDLYVSPWFRKARTWAERAGCTWYILSAKHGLVEPNATIGPYEKTLGTMRAAERKRWARAVLDDLEPRLTGVKSATILAGEAYRKYLEPELRRRGIAVNVPMEGMGIGKQLAWLDRQNNP